MVARELLGRTLGGISLGQARRLIALRHSPDSANAELADAARGWRGGFPYSLIAASCSLTTVVRGPRYDTDLVTLPAAQTRPRAPSLWDFVLLGSKRAGLSYSFGV